MSSLSNLVRLQENAHRGDLSADDAAGSQSWPGVAEEARRGDTLAKNPRRVARIGLLSRRESSNPQARHVDRRRRRGRHRALQLGGVGANS